MKVVINVCHGGFSLSKEANDWLKQRGAAEGTHGIQYTIKRDDPLLIECVETLGEAAETRFSKLRVIEIPDGIKWQVGEYDGTEWETHRKWEYE